jgi:O-antigen/teichoic acid export membrane protein
MEMNGIAQSATVVMDDQERFLRTDHLHGDLRGKSISGTFVTGAAQAVKFLLNLASTVILARLLSPKDFGLVAMVVAVTSFLRIFKDAGLSTATVQREGITHAQVSNLFWINLTLSGLLGLIVAALAPAIAWFYHDPRLVSITLLLSITFLLSGATVQHQALLNRQMRFKALAVIDIGSMAAGLLVGVSMALLGWGYWSLVGACLASELIGLLTTIFVSQWRPQLPVRGSKTWPLLTFGANLTLGNLIFSLSRGVDSALIGRFYGAGAVGLYSRAMALLMRPLEQFMTPIGAVFLPALSRLQSEPERYRRTFLQIYEAIALISFLFTALMLPLARPITLLLLGPKWEGAALIFGGFTIAALFAPVVMACHWLFTTQGRGAELLALNTILAILNISSFIIGLPYGPVGVAFAFSLSGILIRLPIIFHVAGRRGPVGKVDLWTGFLKHVSVWLVTAGFTWITLSSVGNLPPLSQLVFCGTVGLLVGAIFIFSLPSQRHVALNIIRALNELRVGKVSKSPHIDQPKNLTLTPSPINRIPKELLENDSNSAKSVPHIFSGNMRALAQIVYKPPHSRKTVFVFGDSHTDVFSHINAMGLSNRLYFEVTSVAGATAQGMVNPNSQTNSLRIFETRIEAITDKRASLIFLLGEVDTGFVIWYRSEKYNQPVETQLERSITNYFQFLARVQSKGFRRIFIMSAPLPTIRDNQYLGDIANLRKEIKATLAERTRLTLLYNAKLCELSAAKGFIFGDFDTELLDPETGFIKTIYLNRDPKNHHLDIDRYAAICNGWIGRVLD